MLLLLVDCQIGCACFSHSFSLSLFFRPKATNIHRADSFSLSSYSSFLFRDDDDSASKIRARAKEKKRITLDVVRVILSPSTVVLTSLLNSSIKMERANKKESERECH